MKLLIVSGSQRANSQSAKVAQYLLATSNKNNSQHYQTVSHIELCHYNLPFWDGDDESKQQPDSAWPLIKKKIQQADALILITPEWHGMASPLIRNFLLMCDAQDTAHKPVLLVSVVSGISGAYPISELRMNGFKNNKLVAIPDHLIVRNVEEVLNDIKDEMSERDESLRKRIDYHLHILHQYSSALQTIRLQHKASLYPKQQEYLYGM
jgi:NAD(P)H-dependent FMN reductase